MTLQDLFLAPIYLTIIYSVLLLMRNNIRDKNLRRYFIIAFSFKVLGAIALGLIYQFYYNGGDTYNFFRDSRPIWEAFWHSPGLAFQIIFAQVGDYSPEMYEFTRRIYFFSAGDEQTFNVVRVSGFLALISFNTYTVIAIFFALISFSGMWAMYRAMYDMFPQLHRPLAYACFFVPSVYFWGSGLLKDSLTLGALGWVFHCFYFIFFKRKNLIFNSILLLINVLLIQSIKVFILAWFAPAASIWLFMQYRMFIKNRALRILALPVMFVSSLPLGYYGVQKLTEDNQRYNLENITQTATITSDYLKGYVASGSAYDLGEVDLLTPVGIINALPKSIWLGLFRPHPWETRGSPVIALSALESFFILFLTFRILVFNNIFKVFNVLLERPFTLFCLTFAVFVAFSVAVSSGNYGSMVRYRIPMFPFYMAMLYVLRFYLNKSTKLF
ncbi:MAG: hypothetical protein MUE85_12995 [Microscillaceae bacterium]|jgi:hypothetical protein|nr:hypothetical protein [Microscillaceae bacterium]